VLQQKKTKKIFDEKRVLTANFGQFCTNLLSNAQKKRKIPFAVDSKSEENLLSKFSKKKRKNLF